MTQAANASAMNPAPVTLTGQFVKLEPLDLSHAEDLVVAGVEKEIWDYMPMIAPQTLEDMQVAIRAALAAQKEGSRLPFAIIDLSNGHAVGSTSYLDISPSDRRIEIGWTWLRASVRRTAINTECKYLLLRHAFETLGCGRVQLKCDGRNQRSQDAIERIGGTKEGVLRKHMILPDGFVRDTVMFSILVEEWPGIKTNLKTMLASR